MITKYDVPSIFFPSSADSKIVSCQLLVNEWALNTGQLSLGGLPRKMWLGDNGRLNIGLNVTSLLTGPFKLYQNKILNPTVCRS